MENDFNDLSIDFPSIESVNETDLDDLKELQKLCDETTEEAASDVKIIEGCDNEIMNKEEELTENCNNGEINVKEAEEISSQIETIPSAPAESITDPIQRIHSINLHDTSKTLYPDLQNLQSIAAMTSSQQISEKVLSPIGVKPFTPLQIEQLYSNNEIRLIQLFEHEFIQKELKDASLQEHPLYVLLKKLAKARSRLLHNSNDTALRMKKLDEVYKKIWRIDRKTVSAHGFCPCGKAVRATHDYRFATFDEDVNNEMERNMKEIQKITCFNHTRLSQDCALFQRQIEQMLGELMNSKAFQNITKNSPIVLNEDVVALGGNEVRTLFMIAIKFINF